MAGSKVQTIGLGRLNWLGSCRELFGVCDKIFNVTSDGKRNSYVLLALLLEVFTDCLDDRNN